MKPGTARQRRSEAGRIAEKERAKITLPFASAADRFTKRDRPCARCGNAFTTTQQRRLLCESCWKNHG